MGYLPYQKMEHLDLSLNFATSLSSLFVAQNFIENAARDRRSHELSLKAPGWRDFFGMLGMLGGLMDDSCCGLISVKSKIPRLNHSTPRSGQIIYLCIYWNLNKGGCSFSDPTRFYFPSGKKMSRNPITWWHDETLDLRLLFDAWKKFRSQK